MIRRTHYFMQLLKIITIGIISAIIYLCIELGASNIDSKTSNGTPSTIDINGVYMRKDYGDIATKYEVIRKDFDSVSAEMEEIRDALIVNDSKFTLSVNKGEMISLNLLTKEATQIIPEPNWTKNEAIAIDTRTGKLVFTDTIIDETVVIPYEESGYEILFCGQLNSRIHWDGECIINAYKNGVLVYITEADYDDGILIRYKQAFLDSGYWYTSKRIIVGDVDGRTVSYGETWKYSYGDDIYLNFDFYNASSDDMLTVDKLRLMEIQNLKEYYCGKTWNGKYNHEYNDKEYGPALLVKYNPNGTVKTLYQGGFSDGLFDDGSNTAWEIAEMENTHDYYLYEGMFIKGKHAPHDPKQEPLSLDEINYELGKRDLTLDIEWDVDSKPE